MGLENKPYDLPVVEGNEPTFELVTTIFPRLLQDQVLVKPVYFSNDPAQRTWIAANADTERAYVPSIDVGKPIMALAIGSVIESRVSHVPLGTLVYGFMNWSEYVIMDLKDILSIFLTPPGLSVTHFMGSLGLTGLTAYYGLYDIVKATADDSVVISGAAGAVGSMAVQIARNLIGCQKVIGIAGTDEKCRLVENLGAAVCLNYRSPSFEQDLVRESEGFVDVFFDNVGGHILDLMLKRLKAHGRVAACGAIANYNRNRDPTGLKNYFEVVLMRLQILGFNVAECIYKAGEVTDILVKAWKNGQIIISDETETIFESKFEDIPRTWLRLFAGDNKGKMITKII